MKRFILKAIGFSFIFIMLLQVVTRIFVPKWFILWESTRIVKGFYEQPKNTVDVLLLGSSHIITGISPLDLYEEYQITAYGLGTEQQSMLTSLTRLEEALMYQNPEVVILDMFFLFRDSEEQFYRKALDEMKLSAAKIKGAWSICKNDSSQSFSSYLFPIARYHERWKSLGEGDFTYWQQEKEDYLKGYIELTTVYPVKYNGFVGNESVTRAPYDEKMKNAFDKIVNLCNKNEIELVLIKTPYDYWTVEQYLTINDLALEYDLAYFDFNVRQNWDLIQFDETNDFADETCHLNMNGAKKVSDFLGSYMINFLTLPKKSPDSK